MFLGLFLERSRKRHLAIVAVNQETFIRLILLSALKCPILAIKYSKTSLTYAHFQHQTFKTPSCNRNQNIYFDVVR